jgi:hypothetical protein
LNSGWEKQMNRMSRKTEIWNILHDGPISAVSGAVPGDVKLTIGIEYLRKLFPGDGDSFGLWLRGCRLFEMELWETESRFTADFAEISAAQPTILSADHTDTPVMVWTTIGGLRLDFDEWQLELEDSTPVSFDEISAACESYWDDRSKPPEGSA